MTTTTNLAPTPANTPSTTTSFAHSLSPKRNDDASPTSESSSASMPDFPVLLSHSLSLGRPAVFPSAGERDMMHQQARFLVDAAQEAAEAMENQDLAARPAHPPPVHVIMRPADLYDNNWWCWDYACTLCREFRVAVTACAVCPTSMKLCSVHAMQQLGSEVLPCGHFFGTRPLRRSDFASTYGTLVWNDGNKE